MQAPLVAACRIYFPDQGLTPGALHWELGVLTTGPPGKSELDSTEEHSLVRYFVECPSVRDYLMFSPCLHWGYGFWEEDHRDEVAFSSLHMMGGHVSPI